MGYRLFKRVIPTFIWGSLSLLILALPTTSLAQARDEGGNTNTASSKKKGFDPKRLIFGGSLGGSFGNNITFFEISPRVGYLLTDSWIAGVSLKYAYYEEKNSFFDYSTSMYGGGVYTQYYFLKYFVAHAEYELLNLDDFRPPFERTNIHSIFVGGGISSRIGNSNSFFNAILLYNLNETYNSPYANPYLQIGVGFGL